MGKSKKVYVGRLVEVHEVPLSDDSTVYNLLVCGHHENACVTLAFASKDAAMTVAELIDRTCLD